ncbi:MAG: hypothetical protein L0177_08155 [Chloroflexi bacterium]|nr:hypothetical protein [Chloroflexota bacterium]
MQVYEDFEGRQVRLTDERISHIMEQGHYQIFEIPNAIADTLASPHRVVQSIRREQVKLYHRWYTGTRYGDKWVVVVIVDTGDDAFILTGYISTKVQNGRVIWSREI